jgi:hypothetical protein
LPIRSEYHPVRKVKMHPMTWLRVSIILFGMMLDSHWYSEKLSPLRSEPHLRQDLWKLEGKAVRLAKTRHTEGNVPEANNVRHHSEPGGDEDLVV